MSLIFGAESPCMVSSLLSWQTPLSCQFDERWQANCLPNHPIQTSVSLNWTIFSVFSAEPFLCIFQLRNQVTFYLLPNWTQDCQPRWELWDSGESHPVFWTSEADRLKGPLVVPGLQILGEYQVKETSLLWVPLWLPKLSTERKMHSVRAVGLFYWGTLL